jgi:SNF2 family DNA or RNA helicase
MKLQDSQNHDYEPYQGSSTSLEKHLSNYPSTKGEPEEDIRTIIVIGQHRYYKLFSTRLVQCKIGKAGQLKNPLTIVNPIDFMWKAQQPEALKFYAAVTKFQSFYDKSEADKEALQALFSNPMNYPVYEHKHEISDKINVKSLVPAGMSAASIDFKIIIERIAEQYIVSGALDINQMPVAISEIDVRLNHCIVQNSHWYLCSNDNVLHSLSYFNKHQNHFTFNEAAFLRFQRDVLNTMEAHVEVHRTYLSKQQTEKHERETPPEPEKLIYLEEDGDYITLLPVMRYFPQEVALRSKTQLYGRDKHGDYYLVARDNEAEDHFMSLLSRQHSQFNDQMDNALLYFYLHKSHFLDENWFLKAYEEWQRHGITILGFNEIQGNKLNPNKARVNIEVTSGLNWFNTQIDVRFGHQKASLKHLRKAVKNKSKYVPLDDGTIGILPEEWVEKFARYFASGQVLKEELRLPKTAFTTIDELFDDHMLDSSVKTEIEEYHKRLSAFTGINKVEQPKSLKATLRNYQAEGLSWLNFLDDFNFGGCLADDMGLGKTLQVIAFILHLKQKHGRATHLVVLPTSLIHNWQQELQRFAPELNVHTHYGNLRTKSTDGFNDNDVILTSYGHLVSDISFLKLYGFGYVFLDEAQNIKNTTSQRYKAARLLKAKNRLAITGTPIENNTFDLYAQLSFTCPGLLGTKTFFRHTYAIPIDKFKRRDSAAALHQITHPFILRRTKRQVAAELPEKTEIIMNCKMGPVQRHIYDAYEKEFREYISAHDDDEIEKSPMHVLRGITRLRQICNSPVLVGEENLKGETPAKITALIEQLRNISTNHKVLVFSQFVGMLDLIRNELHKENIMHVSLTGKTKNRSEVVRQFQEDEETRVFLISLKAGGTGLNLTAADYVFLVDPWWNPAVENQAIDRIYRIGQEKHVIAVRLICPDTVEEKIQLMQQDKSHLAKKLISANGSILNNLGKEGLLSIATSLTKV